MSEKSLSVEGIVINSELGTGLANLSIEVWSLGEDAIEPLDKVRSDARGTFDLSVPLEPDLNLDGGIVRLEFRVLDRGELIIAEIREFGLDREPQPVQIFVPNMAPHRSRGDEAKESGPTRHEVYGRVRGPLVAGAKIRAILFCLSGDGSEQEVVGETPVDESGAYHLEHDLPQTSTAAGTRLQLQLLGPDDGLLVESDAVDISRHRLRIDLRMSGGGPSEYELLEERLYSEREVGSAVLDGLSSDALFELADEIDVAPERLALLQRVRALEVETGLPGPIFYALGRNGLSVELEDLIDVPMSELRATIVAAVNDEIVDETIVQGIESRLTQLSERVLDRVLEADQPPLIAGLGETLASADVPRAVLRKVLERYQTRPGGVAEFWESLFEGNGEQEAVSEDVRSELETAVGLGGLLGTEPVLIRRMLALRKDGRWRELEDLADFEFDDWCELLESLDAPDTAQIAAAASAPVEDALTLVEEGTDSHTDFEAFDIDIEGHATEPVQSFDKRKFSAEAMDGYERIDDTQAAYALEGFSNDESEFDGDELDEDELEAYGYDELHCATVGHEDFDEAEEDEQDWVEIRAEGILDTLEEVFPSAFIRRELLKAEVLSDGTRRLLERTRKHDFLSESIRERTAQDSELFEGFESIEAEAVIEEVEAIERVSRVTHRAEEVLVLVGSGMNSAHAIAAQPRGRFIDVYGEALGGRAQASRVHAQAQQTAASSTLAMVRLLQALQQTPFVLGGSVAQVQATRNRAIKGMPDTRTLFGNIGLCDCEHCRSVYSPAAYLVDLLRYLDVRDSERLKKLQEKLRERRRPEREIRKLSQYRPLDVLLARRPDIADISLTCENTLTPLPYIDLVNELLEARITGRSAAHDTGSTPADVLQAVPQHVDRDAYERLRLAVYPATLPFHEPLAVARAYLGHLGLQRRDLLKSLARGEGRDDALLAETLEMSPEEFDIVSKPPSQLWRYFGFETEQVGGVAYTQALAHAPTFLSTTGISFQELIDLVSTRFINPKDEIKLESPSPDCDPEKARITGLDENRLSAMVRILRLRKRLGFSLIDLDRALFALGAKDLDPPILQKLVEARDLSKKLDRPIVELLGLWSSLDTFGKDNQFERLLRTRAVAWRIQDADAFKLQENRLELAHTADSLDALAPALLAAFRMTSEELSLARALHARLAGPPRLDLAGLSAVYRVAFLARALKLRIDQLDGLLRLVPADANPFRSAPFRSADPAATRRFVEIVHEVQASAFAPEQLVYLYHPTETLRRDPGPAEAQVQSVLASIRQGLVDAFSETARPAELTGDFLRQKLGMWLDSALVDPAMEALDPRTRLTAENRRQFFNRHLTRIFPDAEAAAQSLFTTSPPAVSVVTPAASKISGEEPAAASVQSAASAAAAPARDSAGEQKWRANIERVVDHLLPLLRARQMRGAVVKVFSDTLGMSSVSTGRLLDGVMHSRRSVGRPLIEDFFALLGTGLTGSYFTNRELQGEPTVTRTDAKLEFSWAGAPPAPGIGGTGFSIRWAGRLLPRSKKRHTFFVSTDGGVRLSMTVDGIDHVLLEETGGKGSIAEYASKDIPLDPAKLYELKIEYRNRGAASSFAVQYGTSPDSKQPIPTANLFPVDGLSTFDPVSLSYRRLHKAALLITGFGISEDQLEWLTGEPRYLDLDKLPMAPTESDQAIASFQRWRQLAALYALRKKLPTSTTDLFAFFKAGTLAEAITILVKASGWDKSVVEAFVGEKGFAVDRTAWALPIDPAQEPFLLRLERAVEIQRRAGVSPETLFAWAGGAPDADVATAIVQAVKARYDEKRWLEVAEGLNGPLRMERREALVTYLLPRLRELGVENRSQLFEYFLIDVEMNPCMLTSRIKQAISAIQTFYQRCLMNLESQVHPRLINEGDWKWLKNYRVWEANRKVFLYPENWIEPELRDDKSPDFKALERTILQQEINKENVESAFIDYLQRLDEVSRLDVRAVWFERRERKSRGVRRQNRRILPPGAEWEEGTYHIFARTYNAPHKWFYRRLERGRTWTPWEKMDVDIEGDHLVPVMFQNRMHLFWTIFREKSKPTPDLKKDAAPFKLGKDWEIGLAYSVYDRGRWTRKQLSSANVVDNVNVQSVTLSKKGPVFSIEGSAWLPASAYTLRADAQNGSFSLTIYLYRRAVDSLRAARTVLRAFEDALLSKTDVELVARFELVGCNGELGPVTLGSSARIVHLGPQVSPRKRRRAQPSRLPPPTQLPPFQVSSGGRLPVPPGYIVDGNGFSAAESPGALLSMRTSTGGMGVVLGRSRGSPRGIRILPIVDTSRRPIAGLFPFFFQDPLRTYFVRPVAIWIGPSELRRPPTTVPLVGPAARVIVPHFGRRPGARLARRTSGARGRRRESLELAQSELALEADLGLERSEGGASEVDLHLEAIDDWEDAEDEAWHPDDASERRSQRQRTPPARKPQPSIPARKPQLPPSGPGGAVRTLGRVRTQAHWEQRLRFTPFEHPQTCRLINVLKSDGIEELLALSTTRPMAVVSQVQDHRMVHGRWLPLKQTNFERLYRPGVLADRRFPRLDIDFDYDNPYALYNWELFFHAPLQVATRLAKDGRHEEAQRWFHFIFDPTSDVSSPPPQRYWRFAPFHENTDYNGARELMALLSYSGTDSELKARKQKVEDQVNAWWEQPFSPHAIARLRISAYQKAVVMKYIDNLIEWGDKLFRRDTMETIQEATQLYILASNILGSRLERVPSMVETKPVTFREVRDKLDLFANWAVRFENSQVRRPFRINARPDTGATTSILGMATLYFCIPANPELDKKWDTVADRLFKIRNCMNIAGVVRRLPLFEPPIDPRILVRAAAAGVDLGSVIASLNAPPPIHRFRFLVQRAIGLADQLRSFGAATLNALERRDAEQLAALRQSNETVLLESIRDMHKTKVKQVEEEIAWLALQREYVDVQIQHVRAQAQQLMNPQESAKQQSLTEAQVIAGVAEGIDLASKVAYAIPDFQAGTAGGFSSPFVTVQMGGQMFGDVAAAVAESMFKVMNKFETEAEMSGAQAEYQRRQVELMHQHELLAKERERIQKQIGEIQLKLEISNAELKRHDTAVENARKVAEYLREKYTSEELYGWMLGQLSTAFFQAYKFAFDTAKLAERALQFERGDPSVSYIEFSYWDSLKKGLLSGERLLVDIRRMEAAHLEGDQRSLEVTRHVSLKEDAPTALQELLATGRCQLEISEALLDGDFPGHYFRRLKTVSMTMTGPIKTHANINCTLTLLDNRVRTSANASGSYAQAQDGDDSRFLINVVPVQAIATSRPNADPGVFKLRFDDNRYLPFEGAGAISSWRIDLRQSDNAIDLSELADVVVSLSYTAKSGGTPLEAVARASRETSLSRGGLVPPPQHRVSLRHDLPELWKQLQAANADQNVELKLLLSRARLPGRFLEFDARIEGSTIYAHSRNKLADDVLRLQIAPPAGGVVPVAGWNRPWPSSQTLRANSEAKGPPGPWTLTVGAKAAKVTDLLDDLILIFDLRAQRTRS